MWDGEDFLFREMFDTVLHPVVTRRERTTDRDFNQRDRIHVGEGGKSIMTVSFDCSPV
jgi:hypothetical protein